MAKSVRQLKNRRKTSHEHSLGKGKVRGSIPRCSTISENHMFTEKDLAIAMFIGFVGGIELVWILFLFFP
jgi:hypothetical protein